ncbi:purine-nucleoside phosphorylase [Clostridium sp. MCC353]|uniref:purine-nucleoside phosphorylase n=1 Tax=Clostridium sp. MCC353 TaxID=2592646 RepID=UPI001C02EECF|nr:purine-nucleoside phosphorylase [Clostridium sp. MCC353]MBT9775457.1 purine-nucleoside phosphorylase [Clostridium sp. MCC353]
MDNAYGRLLKCYESIKDRIPFVPKVALILGSGLGDYGDGIRQEAVIEYKDIEDFPVSTVPGHKGRFIFGWVEDVPVVLMQGRVHYYEGYSMEDVVLPTRLMKLMGAEILFLTNAAGSVNYDYQAGDFMIIRDQISTFVPSPLIGPNLDELGPRFCDMSTVYKEELRQIIRQEAGRLGVTVREGVYIQLTGPEFETPATVKMCRILGADAVGMSTACEAVAASHMGMKICGISCISNLGAGMSDQALSHEEVYETAQRVSKDFKQLVTASIIRMGKEA